MNKKVLAAIVLLLIALGAYFGYTKFMGGKTPGGSSESGPKSLKELLTAGAAQKCTYSTTIESGSSEGITYVSGGKVRGDFTTTTSGKSIVSHMISDGKTSYIWTEGEKNGYKMTVEEQAETDTKTDYSDTSVSSNTNANLDEKLDYKCSAWIADSSVFTPPANVTFTDFSQMFKASAAPSQGAGSSSQCSYCASLTGDSKTQCLAALNCN